MTIGLLGNPCACTLSSKLNMELGISLEKPQGWITGGIAVKPFCLLIMVRKWPRYGTRFNHSNLLSAFSNQSHGQQGQQGIDEDALFGRVQAYVDRRFADFSTELSAAVASSIADEMAKLTINVGSMIEAQIQTHMSRGGNRETPSPTNADLRYNTARREAIGRTPQSAATTPRIRERTLPPGFLPSPPRASPLHQSIEA